MPLLFRRLRLLPLLRLLVLLPSRLLRLALPLRLLRLASSFTRLTRFATALGGSRLRPRCLLRFALRIASGSGLLLFLRAFALLAGEFAGDLCHLGVFAGGGTRGTCGDFGLGGFRIEAVYLHFGNAAAGKLLYVAQRLFGFRAHERYGVSACARPPRAPYAVHVVFRLGGQIVVDNVVHVFHVDAACEHVGCHEHVGFPAGEVVERAPALVLAAVGMDGLGGVAGALQAAARRVGAAARACEHDDALVPPFGEHGFEQRRLERLPHAHDVLVYRVGRLSFVRYFHKGGCSQKLSRRVLDGAVDGGGKQKRLPCFRRCRHDLFHGGPKAHVEHAVGFVEHEHVHVSQAHGLLFHKVHQTSRRGNEHVDAVFKLLDLRFVGKPAHHGEYAVMGGNGYGGAHLANLLGQLPRGRDHDHAWSLIALRAF